MEQLLEVFGINWKLLAAQSVNFGLLVFGLTYFLYKPVLKLLAEREQKIAAGVKAAEAAERALKENQEAKDGIIGGAHRDAESIVTRAEEEAKRERNEIVKTAQQRADSMLNDARLQADELKKNATRESEKDVARLAVLAAEKILKEQS